MVNWNSKLVKFTYQGILHNYLYLSQIFKGGEFIFQTPSAGVIYFFENINCINFHIYLSKTTPTTPRGSDMSQSAPPTLGALNGEPA